MVPGGTLPEEPQKVLAKNLLWFFGNRRSKAKIVAIVSGIEPAPSLLQSVTLTTRPAFPKLFLVLSVYIYAFFLVKIA